MAHYRKIDTRMWGDKNFRSLSMDAKFLWIYLLTGPETTSLPGLIPLGKAGLAESLPMPLESLSKAFRELSDRDMAKADWEARVIWVVNAARYNKPQSPKVVIGWAPHFDKIPECALKYEALKAIESLSKGFSEPFRKAFRKAFERNSIETRIQEQEQEQERERQIVPQRNLFQADENNDATEDTATPVKPTSPHISATPSKTETEPQTEPQTIRPKNKFTIRQFEDLAWKTYHEAHTSRHGGAYTTVHGDKAAILKVANRMRMDLTSAIEAGKVEVDSNGAVNAAAKKWFDQFWRHYMVNPGVQERLNMQGHPVRSAPGDLNGFGGLPEWRVRK